MLGIAFVREVSMHACVCVCVCVCVRVCVGAWSAKPLRGDLWEAFVWFLSANLAKAD